MADCEVAGCVAVCRSTRASWCPNSNGKEGCSRHPRAQSRQTRRMDTFSPRSDLPCDSRRAENHDNIYVTVEISDAKDAKVELKEDSVSFAADSQGKHYALEL